MPQHRRVAPVLALFVVLLATSVASAQSLTGSERVVDETGVISADQRSEALDAIAALDDARNVQLWALFVPTTEGEPVADYATRVAAENGLGGNDALFVVAVDDRRDSLWVGDLLDEVSNEEIDRLLADEVEPRLADGNWGAAIASVADGLDGSLGTTPEEPPSGGGDVPAPSEPGANPLPVLIALALVGGGLWLIWSWYRNRRAVADEDRERTGRLTRLSRDANRLLIETDELLRHNGQELGFAEAEFGVEAAEPFRAALAAARQELQAAFRLRQQLDDNDPETPPERERLLGDIVARCSRARELVEEQTERFKELRDLERRAPEVLAEAERQAAAVSARIPEVEPALAALRSDAPGSSAAVHGNLAEARKRAELATRSTTEGRAALDRGDRPAAGRAAKASLDALAQAGALLDAIEREAAVLEEARSGLDTAMRQARSDVEAATQAVERTPDSDQHEELAAARTKLDAAEGAMGADRDVVRAYRLAREAEAAADRVVASVREGEERRTRQRSAVDAALRSAELQVDRAQEFIAARRHGVGRRPRTALSEADAALGHARELRDSDPDAALAEARRAGELADDAYGRAQRDFTAADQAGYGGTVVIGGRPYGTGRDSGWGGDVGGAIIGGIIGSILSGGGRRGGGGFGGGGFGGGFGGGGGGLGGGRSFGGGFGGGGGGRARGGGW